MKVFRESSLARKIVLPMMLTSSVSLLIAGLSFLSYDFRTFRQNIAEHLNMLADMTGSNVAAALIYHDPKSAARVLRALNGEPYIQAARVYRVDGRAFASYVRNSSPGGAQLPAARPQMGMRLETARITNCQSIVFDQEVVGYIFLDSDLRELELRKHRLVLFVIVLTLVSSTAAFFIALILKRIICTPILGLVETTKRVSREKNYGIHAPSDAKDELELLVAAFNEMLEEINKREAELKSEVDIRIRAEQTMRESEERLQLLLDSTAEAIYGLDIHGLCTFTNKAALRLLGYTNPGDLLGKEMHGLIHHTRTDGTPYPVSECPSYLTMIGGRLGHTDRDVLWRADGTCFPIEGWSHPIRKGGMLTGAVITFIDITERQISQDALRDAHAESELFINSVPSMLVGLDSDGRIIRWNSAAAETFGLSDVEVLGKPLASCGIAWPIQEMENRVKSMLSTSMQSRWDDIPFEKDGQQRLLGMTITRITLSDTEHLKFLIVGADITGRRKAEEELLFKSAFLEAQTNATLDGILVIDRNRDKMLQNRRFVEMFEIPQSISEDRSELPLLEFVLPNVKYPERLIEQVQHLYAHPNETTRDEVEMKNGMVVDRYSSPVIGKDGTYYGRTWIFRDITDRKRTEDAVRQLSLAVEQSPVAVVITDLDGRITYVNHRFTESTGYAFEEVVGQNPRVLKSDRTPQAEYKQLWKTITEGREWRGELCNRKKSGELFWESVVISPIKDKYGSPTYFLAFKEDVTEQRNRESQLRQAQKLEAIGQLAAGIAHEINTPIQFIGDNTRFIKQSWTSLDPVLSLVEACSVCAQGQGDPPDFFARLPSALQGVDTEYLRQEIPQALDQSLEGIARVSKIVQAMKEFSHPGSEEKQLADINKVILTTVTVARNEWKYVADMETVLADNLELVPCHVSEFSQVILNLLINSAHAIAQVVGNGSQGKGKITICTSQDSGWTNISITDTGSGIPPEIRSRVFDPFFTTKGVGKGTGQGLALAHATIVKKHGGRLWFDSEVGKGATFHIQLPLAEKGS